jgi:hypothetical protein
MAPPARRSIPCARASADASARFAGLQAPAGCADPRDRARVSGRHGSVRTCGFDREKRGVRQAVAGATSAIDLSFTPDGSADARRVEYIGVHEFGHVLGFLHEQDLPANDGPAKCTLTAGVDARSTPVSAASDRDSIMNYRNQDGNSLGRITDLDIAGVQSVYGVRSSSSRRSCSRAGAAASGATPAGPAVDPHRPEPAHRGDRRAVR